MKGRRRPIRKLAFRCPKCSGRRFNTISSVGQLDCVGRSRQCRYCHHVIWTEERVTSWEPPVIHIADRYQRDRSEEAVRYVADPRSPGPGGVLVAKLP